MTQEEFLSTHNVSFIYGIKENKIEDNKYEFGWIKKDILDLSEPIILSTSPEGLVSAASLSDYRKMFTNLTSLTPEEMLSEYSNESYMEYIMGKHPQIHQMVAESHFDLARLIANRQNVNMLGNEYVIVEVE